MPLPTFFKNKKIFLTGHTGFKGSWLLQMLYQMGAEVKGYALEPENEDDLFCQIEGDQLCYSSVIGDIRDAHLLRGEIIRFEPEIIIHLAAQPLVRRSYEQPVTTFDTNVMGTINVLEALRELKNPCAGIMITTDKVYVNNESGQAFKESDKLGGHDPYSSSKAAAEIAIESYRKSYFSPETFRKHQKSVVAMRAGNVIGGGDYAEDRIIPDIVRSIKRGEEVQLRNPKAVRPWQHVIEPLAAYLLVAEKSLSAEAVNLLPAYNIGPDASDVLDVETVTKMFIQDYGAGKYKVASNPQNPHEAGTLILDNAAIKRDLGWQPKFNAAQAIRMTADWYARKEKPAREKIKEQVSLYYQ